MASVKCPICGRAVAEGGKTSPFCGERCRLIDLGNWLDQRYVVARPLVGEGEDVVPDGETGDEGGGPDRSSQSGHGRPAGRLH